MIKRLKYNKWKKIIEKSGFFDSEYYLTNYPDVADNNINPIMHYIRHGVKEGRNPSSEFDTKFYLDNNKDVDIDKINPLVHFILHGKKEGRFSFSKLDDFLLKGKKEYDKTKETIVLVSHESSATGAPLLGMNIGKCLANKYNLIHFIMRKSNIHKIFFDDCFLLIEEFDEKNTLIAKKILQKIKNEYKLKTVICNSIVTYPILQIASDLHIPTISLIHEFAEYTRPKDKILNNIIAANKVILPAKIIQNSIMEQLNEIAGITSVPSNISICPQGKLTFLPIIYGDSDTTEEILKKLKIKNRAEYKIIVASGYAQIRKGVDLFIYTAKYIKNYYQGNCKFVWVGDGFNPDDFSYSLWLEREIKHLGLEDDFIFLEHQQNLDVIFSIADIFCLTSRMDPFPNVVIDALEANLPIACFKDASGSVEFLEENNADCIIADYLDTHQLGRMIADYFIGEKEKLSTNQLLVNDKLNFDKYVKFIIQQIEESELENLENLKILTELEKSEYFDNQYVKLFESKSQSIYYYIMLLRKGLERMTPNPSPGFSNLKWNIEYNQLNTIPLYEALKKQIYSTHNSKIVPFDVVNDISLKFAVHLHLYYIDLSDEFIDYFKKLPHGYDLFITIMNNKDIIEVRKKFENCGAVNIEVVVVENIGRDMGPLIFTLKDKIFNNNYDVIGHFHSKKSISTDNEMGNKWRRYLLENLIGNKNISNSVLRLFKNKKIGLIFVEDRHYMDIGQNKNYLDSLCEMINLSYINETPLFPLGNMYWARVDAIKELFLLDEDKILQEEPLPYDGSFMHAIERITPHLVTSNNYEYITVYNRDTSW